MQKYSEITVIWNYCNLGMNSRCSEVVTDSFLSEILNSQILHRRANFIKWGNQRFILKSSFSKFCQIIKHLDSFRQWRNLWLRRLSIHTLIFAVTIDANNFLHWLCIFVSFSTQNLILKQRTPFFIAKVNGFSAKWNHVICIYIIGRWCIAVNTPYELFKLCINLIITFNFHLKPWIKRIRVLLVVSQFQLLLPGALAHW